MSLAGARALLARPAVRVLVGCFGLGILALVIHSVGARAVLAAMKQSAPLFPLLILCEGAILACSLLGLRTLYGEEGRRIPVREWARAGFLGYVLGAFAPMGRAVAEAARAAVLSGRVGGPRAAVAAVQMQGVALMANALASLAAGVATLLLLGPGELLVLILGNAALAFVLGLGVLVVRERTELGRLLGRVVKRARDFGAAFDESPGSSPTVLLRAVIWECCGPIFQLVEVALAACALGRLLAPLAALGVQGVQMVGSTLGDLIPAQLGASEASLALAARALTLTSAEATSIGLLAHLAQLGLTLVCGLSLLLFLTGAPLPARPAELRP